jgi:TPR repeat protein
MQLPQFSLQELTALANQGDAEAEYVLGMRYFHGHEVTEEYQEAAK